MNNLLKNRNTPRILRLAGGIGLGIYAVAAHEPLLWILAGFFLLQALQTIWTNPTPIHYIYSSYYE